MIDLLFLLMTAPSYLLPGRAIIGYNRHSLCGKTNSDN
jgi:hypothetical protein